MNIAKSANILSITRKNGNLMLKTPISDDISIQFKILFCRTEF